MKIDTDLEEHRLQTLFTKEPETIAWISELVKPGEVFFDIGANVGVFTLFAGVKHGKELKIFSFEPIYHNFEKLCRNVSLNELSSCVPYCVAVGSKTGFDLMRPDSDVSGSASLHFKSQESHGDFFDQGIFSVTLDDAIHEFGLPQPQHIKIDTDGFEESVLQGGQRIFRAPELKSVLIEITDKNGARQRILDFMLRAGFNTDHPINSQEDHSRVRRQQKGTGYIENIIFTR